MLIYIRTLFSLILTRKPIYIFLDRPNKADDNAEHLYLYYSKNLPNKNIYFILQKNASDWHRLEQLGFHLIQYKSFFHFLLLVKSKYYISSHLPKYEIWFISKKLLKKFLNFKFIFLQHGITHNDISNILNKHTIDLLITASYAEYSNFIHNKNYHTLSEKNVVLTGFPRFDNLIAHQYKQHEKTILILPTWRAKFTQHSISKPVQFQSSQYCTHWKSFLNSTMLKKISLLYNYKILFVPHPEIEPFIHDLRIPDYIDTISINKTSLQPILSKASLLITDYSSIAFDISIQRKPICYFQFDKESFFTQNHIYQKCYFDYDSNGFGDICYNINSLFLSIEKILQNDGNLSSLYYERIQEFFPYFDTNNAKRVSEEIEKLSVDI